MPCVIHKVLFNYPRLKRNSFWVSFSIIEQFWLAHHEKWNFGASQNKNLYSQHRNIKMSLFKHPKAHYSTIKHSKIIFQVVFWSTPCMLDVFVNLRKDLPSFACKPFKWKTLHTYHVLGKAFQKRFILHMCS